MKTVTLSAHGRYVVVTFPPDDDIVRLLRQSRRLHWKPGLGGWVSEVKDVTGLVLELRSIGLAVRYGPPVSTGRSVAVERARASPPPAPPRPSIGQGSPSGPAASALVGAPPVAEPSPLRDVFFHVNDVATRSFQEAYVARWREPGVGLPTLEPVDLARLDTTFDVPDFLGEFYPFQRQGIAFLRALGWSGIVADEMGLGKTVQAIGAALVAGDRALVVTPAAVKFNWAAEVRRFTGKDARVYSGTSPSGPADAQFTIVNYDLLPRLVDRLNAQEFGMVVLDEAHYVKNPRARRSQAAFALTAPHRVLLTGTPLLNRPEELYPLLSFVQPGKWGSERDYAHLYTRRVTRLAPGGLEVQGAAAEHLRDLKERLRGVMIRRQKATVLRDLPPKTIEVQPIELPPQALEAYRALENDLTDFLVAEGIEGAFRGHGWMRTLAKMHALKQFTIAQRHESARDWLRARADEGEKVVVFSQYLQPLHDLHREFSTESVLVDGSVPSRERLARVDRFQADPGVKFAIGQIQAMGTGLNMTAARHVVFLDLAWTPAAHAQAMDRVHRIGQRRDVLVTFLVTPGTIDEHLQRVLLEKQAVINTVMGERQQIVSETTVLRLVAESLLRARA